MFFLDSQTCAVHSISGISCGAITIIRTNGVGAVGRCGTVVCSQKALIVVYVDQRKIISNKKIDEKKTKKTRRKKEEKKKSKKALTSASKAIARETSEATARV